MSEWLGTRRTPPHIFAELLAREEPAIALLRPLPTGQSWFGGVRVLSGQTMPFTIVKGGGWKRSRLLANLGILSSVSHRSWAQFSAGCAVRETSGWASAGHERALTNVDVCMHTLLGTILSHMIFCAIGG